ncbi:hypothetical protein PZA11_005258 [Diplocarpon coronariae]
MANASNGAVYEGSDIESQQVKRQRSMKFSLYPVRPRTASKRSHPSIPSPPISANAPQIPQLLPMMSREDYYQHPTASHHLHAKERSFTAPPVVHRKPSEVSRLRALNNGYKPNPPDGRHTPDTQDYGEAFSQTRQASLRRRDDSPKPVMQPSATFAPRAHDELQTPTDLDSFRDQGFTTSFSQAPNNLATYQIRPSASIPDYQAPDSIYSRQRNLNNPHHRSRQPINPPDSNYSAHRRDPIPRSNGFEDEEARTSFRSAITTSSSFVGTSGTERSSIITKSSSATSIYLRDEGMSVDDAIGMYEGGFIDSEAEDNGETRSATGDSRQTRNSMLHQTMHDSVMEPDTTRSKDKPLPDPHAFNELLTAPNNTVTVPDSHQMFRTAGMAHEELPVVGERTLIPPDRQLADQPLPNPGRTSRVAPIFDETRDRFKPDPSDLSPGEVRESQQVEPETPMLQALRRVLQAFAIYNPRIGYCQSLNFIAGLLLLFMEEEKAFWMLNIITGVYLPGTHELNLEGANVDLGVLMTSIKDMMPQVWAKIGGELDGSSLPPSTLRLPPITLCTTAWFMSCFIGTLPIESTLRVWDSFFCEGSKTLFRISLTIFKIGEPEIRAVSDPMEIFQVVQTIPRKLVDCNVLMETCFKRRNGFGHLSQDTIERGRAERRKGYAEEREMKERAEKPGSGLDGPAGVARSGTRKAIGFGKKKKDAAEA